MATRRLIIMRHGEAAPAHGRDADRERPLTPRGSEDAKAVGRRLGELGWEVDFVVSSDSRRTAETLEALCAGLARRPEAIWSSRFYLGGHDDMLVELASVDDSCHTLLLLGHNPGWSEAIIYLSGQYRGLAPANAVLMTVDAPTWLDAIGLQGAWRIEHTLC